MFTDKQFIDAFTAAGGWFILSCFEMVYNYNGSKEELINEVYEMGFDSKVDGARTRVNSLIRIIDNDMGYEALAKIRDSKTINKAHPEANRKANELINIYYRTIKNS